MTVSRVELGDAAPLEQQLLLTDVNRSEAQQTIFSARSEAALLELKTTIGLSTSDSLKLPQSFLLEPVFIPAARARGLTPIPPLAEIRQDIRRNVVQEKLAAEVKKWLQETKRFTNIEIYDAANNNNSRLIDVRSGRRLELVTIAWNSLEALIAIGAGLLSGSIALVGFGFDSVIEVSLGTALLWRLSLDTDLGRRERIEAVTLKIVGLTFILLAAYVGIDAAMALLNSEAPAPSYVGIGVAVLSLVVMPLLARAKRRVAVRINSHALQADSRQTDICAYLSAILVGGGSWVAVFIWAVNVLIVLYEFVGLMRPR